MTQATHIMPVTVARPARATTVARDTTIDTMRGIAILMVIGIHALQQPLDAPWKIAVDSALRPCVPIFLFVSGYLTALSGRVPLGKRLAAAVIPYAIAFVAAYIYMAMQNPAMDHRPTTTAARFLLAYVFVYYYVFVYIGCTVAMWLVLRFARLNPAQADSRLTVTLLLAIVFGLVVGSYLDPLLLHRGLSNGLVEEVRMRDIPFWFAFAAAGMLVATSPVRQIVADMRPTLTASAAIAYAIYAAVRLIGIGDDADYDSMAFFGYATALCLVLLAFAPRLRALATLGSGSYFIYLWHIFVIMALRDHAGLHQFGDVASSLITYAIAVIVSVTALRAIQHWAPPRLARWLGA